MNSSAARRTRREIRRALGPEALDLVGQHGHALAQQVDQIAMLQHTVASCVADIALLQAQLVAAGFGTTAAQAEAATRNVAMDRRALHVKYDKLWARVERLHLIQRFWRKNLFLRCWLSIRKTAPWHNCLRDF